MISARLWSRFFHMRRSGRLFRRGLWIWARQRGSGVDRCPGSPTA